MLKNTYIVHITPFLQQANSPLQAAQHLIDWINKNTDQLHMRITDFPDGDLNIVHGSWPYIDCKIIKQEYRADKTTQLQEILQMQLAKQTNLTWKSIESLAATISTCTPDQLFNIAEVLRTLPEFDKPKKEKKHE